MWSGDHACSQRIWSGDHACSQRIWSGERACLWFCPPMFAVCYNYASTARHGRNTPTKCRLRPKNQPNHRPIPPIRAEGGENPHRFTPKNSPQARSAIGNSIYGRVFQQYRGLSELKRGVAMRDQVKGRTGDLVPVSGGPIPAFAGGPVSGDMRDQMTKAIVAWLLRTPSPHTRKACRQDLDQFLAHAGIAADAWEQLAQGGMSNATARSAASSRRCGRCSATSRPTATPGPIPRMEISSLLPLCPGMARPSASRGGGAG